MYKRGQTKSKKSDIWGLGVVLWELSSRKIPFAEVEDDFVVISYIKDGEKEVIPDDCNPVLKKSIELCWKLNPDERPDASDLIGALQSEFSSLKDENSVKDVTQKVEVKLANLQLKEPANSPGTTSGINAM